MTCNKLFHGDFFKASFGFEGWLSLILPYYSLQMVTIDHSYCICTALRLKIFLPATLRHYLLVLNLMNFYSCHNLSCMVLHFCYV